MHKLYCNKCNDILNPTPSNICGTSENMVVVAVDSGCCEAEFEDAAFEC